jgi:hypothetical protein
VNPTEHPAKNPSPRTGLFATLGGLLRADGTGAPSRARITLAFLLAVAATMAFTAAPALAAAPEAPETKSASAETTTTATLNGVLNPLTSAKAGYYFAYSPEISCLIPGFTTPLQLEATVKAETVEAKVMGLEPNKEYQFCLVATNTEGETPGNEVPFTTKPAPPEIIAGSESTAVPVKATAATLEAKINPNNQVTKYQFEYSTEATGEVLEGTIVKVPSAPGTIPSAFNPAGEPVSAATEPLTQGTTYFYRVVAESAKGEPAIPGKVEHLTTAIPPETPEKLEAKPIAAATATLNGVLNPNNAGEAGTYEFSYRQSATECKGGVTTPAAAATGAKEEPAEAKISELLPHTTYAFCLRAHNKAGEESALAGPVTFTTLVAPPKIEEQFATEVASTSATLHATVNPEGAETSYAFEYAPSGGAFKPVPEPEGHGVIPEGVTGVPVSVHVQHGLAASTTYQFRVLVSNSAQKEVTREAVSFTTQAAGEFALPDGRQWEMVSPPQKQGALFEADMVPEEGFGGLTESGVRGARGGD